MYNYPVGAVFIFNIMVGTGTLTMPQAFAEAGYMLGLILLVFMCLISYISATFLTESLAAGNALKKLSMTEMGKSHGSAERLTNSKETEDASREVYVNIPSPTSNEFNPFSSAHSPVVATRERNVRNTTGVQHHDEYDEAEDDDDELECTTRSYSLTSLNSLKYSVKQGDSDKKGLFKMNEHIEVGELCSMFLHRFWVVAFYFIISVYLFGDLSIYSVTVPKSLRNSICSNLSDFDNQTDSDPCWTGHAIERGTVYRLLLMLFICTFGIFVFFDVTKTKLLQLVTSLIRWTSLVMMITLAVMRIARGEGNSNPVAFDGSKITSIFGVLIYAFMVHHSIPTLIVPFKEKKHVNKIMLVDFLMGLSFYASNSVISVFAFKSPDDLYTENFLAANHIAQGFKVFISLYPAMVLCTSFPVVAVVLRNNLKALVRLVLKRSTFPFLVDRIVFPIVTLSLPVTVALCTTDVESLVNITGGISGGSIEFLFPALLAYYSRKHFTQQKEILGPNIVNPYKSFFAHNIFVYFMAAWTVIALVFTVVGLATN